MILLISDSTISLTLTTFPLLFQVFEDGSTYHGCLKALTRTIIKTYYADIIQPNIVEGHNSDQAAMVVRDTISKTLKDLSFLCAAQLDDNVSFKNHSHSD